MDGCFCEFKHYVPFNKTLACTENGFIVHIVASNSVTILLDEIMVLRQSFENSFSGKQQQSYKKVVTTLF